ncbi:hypothetical protein E3N88_15020 [Mikania micrantha]|uniref:Uncharacterized protein n=1 Tax=Mikania micrantha TaxID=192012 RepID=A0A5N6P342_9ASTR|nr:hypothetical protein E3N88_15020 [Mikania micrantha]
MMAWMGRNIWPSTLMGLGFLGRLHSHESFCRLVYLNSWPSSPNRVGYGRIKTWSNRGGRLRWCRRVGGGRRMEMGEWLGGWLRMSKARMEVGPGRIGGCRMGRPANERPRAFVAASKPLLKEKTDEKIDQTCQDVTEAADKVKEGFTEVVSNIKNEIKGKLSEAKESLTKRARENVVDVVAQKTKEKVKKNLK